MAETTIDVPALGPTKKVYVYGGLAVVAGLVMFAYFRRASQPVDTLPPPEEPNPELIPDSDYDPVGETDNGIWDLTGGAITTNAEWSQRATTHLSNIGFEPILVAVALGKFFQREGLQPNEADAVKAAVGQFGPPPENGPWPIKLAEVTKPPATTDPDTTPGTLARPTGGRQTGATATSVTIAWNPVAGAKSYSIRLRGQAGRWNAASGYTEGTSYTQVVPLANTDYELYVQAQGSQRSDGSFPQSDLITINARSSG